MQTVEVNSCRNNLVMACDFSKDNKDMIAISIPCSVLIYPVNRMDSVVPVQYRLDHIPTLFDLLRVISEYTGDEITATVNKDKITVKSGKIDVYPR